MRIKAALIFIFSLLFFISYARQKSGESQEALVFTHVTIIDTSGGPSKTDRTVFIKGDRISDIKRTGKVRPPKGAQVIDATGKFLIPGLWDMHAHCNDIRDLSLFIANGVTGVRVMWGFPMHHAWRKEISKGFLIGPRLIIASPIIDGPTPLWPGSASVSSEAEARQAVRQAKENGADFIKILEGLSREAYFAIAVESKKLGLPFAGHIPWTISATEASDAGQKCIEHTSTAVSPGFLLGCSNKEEELRKEGAKTFQGFSAQKPPTPSQMEALRSYPKKVLETYDDKIAAPLFECFVKNNTWVCPTLIVRRNTTNLDDKNITDDPHLKYMPKSARESWERTRRGRIAFSSPEDWALGKIMYQKGRECVGSMRRAGVKIIAGTDTGNPYCMPGFSLHDELGLLVQAGLTPMEALQAASYNAAEFLDMKGSMGTIETGKIADLVLLEANPLEDIGNTKKIAAVVVNGKCYLKPALEEMLAKAEVLANQTPTAEITLKTIKEIL